MGAVLGTTAGLATVQLDAMMEDFESGLAQEQPSGPPMPSEQATSRIYDPITAGLIHDTPSPDEIFRAIRTMPVINPLAIMRGQQTGPEMLPSTIIKAQRMSAVKERAQLLALLQDTQQHDLMRQRITTEQGRLAFDVMKQKATQGSTAVGAIYKTFSDIAPGMDPEQANKWLDGILKEDVSGGLPNEAAGRQMALQALLKAGGLKAKEKAQGTPSGFIRDEAGNLMAEPGGPEDLRVIRQQAQARHIESSGGGGGGGYFAPQILPIQTQERNPDTGEMTTTTNYMAGMKPKGGTPYAVPLAGAPQAVKSKPLAMAEAGRIQGTRQGAEIVDQIEQQVFPNGQLDRGVLAGATAARYGAPGIAVPEGALVNQRILQAMDPYVRATTGAALNEQELKNANQMFAPGVGDSEAQVRDKLDRLRQFLSGNLSLMGMVLQPGSQAYNGLFSQRQSHAQPPSGYYPTPPANSPAGVLGPEPTRKVANPANLPMTGVPGPAKVLKFNPATGRVE